MCSTVSVSRRSSKCFNRYHEVTMNDLFVLQGIIICEKKSMHFSKTATVRGNAIEWLKQMWNALKRWFHSWNFFAANTAWGRQKPSCIKYTCFNYLAALSPKKSDSEPNIRYFYILMRPSRAATNEWNFYEPLKAIVKILAQRQHQRFRKQHPTTAALKMLHFYCWSGTP